MFILADKPFFTAEFLRDWEDGKGTESPLEVMAESIVIAEYYLQQNEGQKIDHYLEKAFAQLSVLCDA